MTPRRRSRLAPTLVAGALALAAPLSAQKPREKADDIPPGHRPPPGMCRIWIDDVPPGQQPAPTDCATAVRNRPANGRVIFGDDYVKQERSTKGKVQDLLKEFRRGDDAKDDDKAAEKRKRYRKP